MFRLPLSNGGHTLIDHEDAANLSRTTWRRTPNGYAVRSVNTKPGVRIDYMHRIIMGNPVDKEIDHLNGDKLDNRKANLRICNRSQNVANNCKRSNVSSRYKGVCWVKERSRWLATVKSYKLGYFKSEKDAAYAHNIAAQIFFGKFARLNCL